MPYNDTLSRLEPALRAFFPPQAEAAIHRTDDTTMARIPIHTVYVPADKLQQDTPTQWGKTATAAITEVGGFERFVEIAGVPESQIPRLATRVEARLTEMPIEDLRIDFEDGYLLRGTAAEPQDARRAGALAEKLSINPMQIGIRISPLSSRTAAQALGTLEEFLNALCSVEQSEPKLVVTVPKVNSAREVEAANLILETAERSFALHPGAIALELQAETPDLITLLLQDSGFLARMHEQYPRISGIHYGTYDYSASLGIDPAEQRLDHPSADFAKQVLQLATRRGRVRLSDGSTNIVPNLAYGVSAWKHHFELVKRSLRLGIDQGWDMHPLHLPSRILAIESYYLAASDSAVERLFDYHARTSTGVMDEPASARALASFLRNGIRLGALDLSEVTTRTGLTELQLNAYARTGFATERTNA
ncbi:aldolase [Leucobacter sp. UT-8R-CII-1-4]|uniref:DUF6986 family protein n=1 Tax=Leucobacter sp. UT-8R-CII-1-4 TaxID=3040075 RepID=UPI0024A833CF|nr:aldolase [Leucobacter sp. UT-8R-CII-1-4]MDI6023187.1 aldolase [Leucobacter sp. UT-8R-CII-1-4]